MALMVSRFRIPPEALIRQCLYDGIDNPDMVERSGLTSPTGAGLGERGSCCDDGFAPRANLVIRQTRNFENYLLAKWVR
jgi:hypothetical protein